MVGWLGDHGPMGIADGHLAEVGAPTDEWDREHAAEVVDWLRGVDPVIREAEVLHHAAQPVNRLMIDFMLGRFPGTRPGAGCSVRPRRCRAVRSACCARLGSTAASPS